MVGHLSLFCSKILSRASSSSSTKIPQASFFFAELPFERQLATWQARVFDLSLVAEKIDQETMDQMRSWPHSGFSVHKSVCIPPHDTSGLERLAQYILRCRFSLACVVRLTDDGSVIYRAEQDHCRRFPGPASADLWGGPRRNYQGFTALDFLAEVTQHIPNKGEHLVRYYGWYSHGQRGIRAIGPDAAVRSTRLVCWLEIRS
jgi:hypothetical protein